MKYPDHCIVYLPIEYKPQPLTDYNQVFFRDQNVEYIRMDFMHPALGTYPDRHIEYVPIERVAERPADHVVVTNPDRSIEFIRKGTLPEPKFGYNIVVHLNQDIGFLPIRQITPSIHNYKRVKYPEYPEYFAYTPIGKMPAPRLGYNIVIFANWDIQYILENEMPAEAIRVGRYYYYHF